MQHWVSAVKQHSLDMHGMEHMEHTVEGLADTFHVSTH